jgi:hypothetical protein
MNLRLSSYRIPSLAALIVDVVTHHLPQTHIAEDTDPIDMVSIVVIAPIQVMWAEMDTDCVAAAVTVGVQTVEGEVQIGGAEVRTEGAEVQTEDEGQVEGAEVQTEEVGVQTEDEGQVEGAEVQTEGVGVQTEDDGQVEGAEVQTEGVGVQTEDEAHTEGAEVQAEDEARRGMDALADRSPKVMCLHPPGLIDLQDESKDGVHLHAQGVIPDRQSMSTLLA